ncbi:MAG: hypothetical protein LBK06_10080, partial [Planctomycetaceae bacterium]|nr:hypothetical protein [Planctomycetaceae bacterium]
TALYGLTKLNCLTLRSCTFQTDKTAESFYEFIEKRAVNLRTANLINIPDIELHIQAIIDKPDLEIISMESNNITDELLSGFKMSVRYYKVVEIKSNSISDNGLMQIQLEPKTKVRLVDTKITEDGLKKFLQANPYVTGQFTTYISGNSDVFLIHQK